MIDLTPLEVRKKKGDFRKAMRGYEPQAVDDFLDLVADRLEQLVRENASLQERVGSTTQQVSDYRERERALTEALVTAQEMREQMRQQVEREVELKLREAEADAEEVRTAVAQMREREEENVRRLRARQTQFVQSYRTFLERELAELSVMTQTLDMSMQDEPSAPAPRRRTRKAEPPASQAPPATPAAAVTPATPDVVPIPMPLPEAIPEDVSTSDAEPGRDMFDEPQHELIDLSMHFPPVEEVTPSYVTPEPEPAPAPPAPTPAAPAPTLAPEPLDMPIAELHLDDEIPELELLEPLDEIDAIDEEEEPKKDDDADGWVSTLLEGKGD